MATILVTGGAGYIGAHVAKALAGAGHMPVVYDDLSSGHAYAVRWGPLEEGDVVDGARLGAVLARHRPAVIVHLAASSLVCGSLKDPLAYWHNNVTGSRTLLECARRAGVRRIVFSSTCAVYGAAGDGPLAEGTPFCPLNPYGETKLAVERMLAAAATAYGIDAVALRYFNAAGASADGEIGEDHRPETHLVPLILAAAHDPSRTLSIYGTDYPTPDGSCVRDYVHVEDLAAAHVMAAERLLAGTLAGFTGLNLGSGRGVSVLALAAAAARVTGVRVRTEVRARRPGDPPTLFADTRAAARVLGWRPLRSDIETILASAWAWTRRADQRSASHIAARTDLVTAGSPTRSLCAARVSWRRSGERSVERTAHARNDG